MAKKWVIFCVLSCLLVACVTNEQRPSVCGINTAPSLLCEIADSQGVALEHIGDVLIVSNAVAIGAGAYRPEDALRVLKDIRGVLDNPVSYIFFRNVVRENLAQNPALFEISDVYFNNLNSPQIMHSFDRAILKSWLDKRIESMENLSESFGGLNGSF